MIGIIIALNLAFLYLGLFRLFGTDVWSINVICDWIDKHVTYNAIALLVWLCIIPFGFLVLLAELIRWGIKKR